jgi:hypothetical protein
MTLFEVSASQRGAQLSIHTLLAAALPRISCETEGAMEPQEPVINKDVELKTVQSVI